MFSSIRLKNFKVYKDSGDIPLAPLTVIVGLNNCGKSTIFHALLALKQTTEDKSERSSLVTQGRVNLNGFYDILHRSGSAPDSQSFSISLAMNHPLTVMLGPGPRKKKATEIRIADAMEVSFALGKESKDIEVQYCKLSAGNKTIIANSRTKNTPTSDIIPQSVLDATKTQFKNIFPILSLPAPAKGHPMLSEDILFAINNLGIQNYAWAQWILGSIHAISPLRQRVPWSAGVGTKSPSELGSGGENLLAALGSEERPFTGKKRLLDLMNDWLSEKQILSKLHVETDKANSLRMLLGDEVGGLADINVAGMGEGISQILPIVARTRKLEQDNQCCLLVEQPEIHLHPSLQADLADLFVDIAKDGADSVPSRQVIVETHSEHLVLRIRRRIAAGTIDASRVAILYVQKQGTESTVRRLDLNQRGHFSDWPKGFFDEAYQEAMILAEEASRRPRNR